MQRSILQINDHATTIPDFSKYLVLGALQSVTCKDTCNKVPCNGDCHKLKPLISLAWHWAQVFHTICFPNPYVSLFKIALCREINKAGLPGLYETILDTAGPEIKKALEVWACCNP